MVCRDLLLDLQHHASIWRRGDAGRARASVSFLPLSCSLSWRLRFADQPFGKSPPDGGSKSNRGEGAGPNSFTRRVLLLAPFLWVAVELARTRITGFPWDLLGIAQVDNIPMARVATVTGVYGLSFEIMVVNTALAAAFVIGRRSGPAQQADAVVAGNHRGCGCLAGGEVDQSAGFGCGSERPSGTGECTDFAGRRLDQGIL